MKKTQETQTRAHATKPRKQRSDPALQPVKKAAFLSALAECCRVDKSCQAIGITRATAYRWREEDAEFEKAWSRAVEIAVTALEDEAHRRAFEGVDEPLTHQGMMTYRPKFDATGSIMRDSSGKVIYETDKDGRPIPETVKKYSDSLAMFLLKAHAPEKYRERQDINVTGSIDIATRISEARRRTGGGA